MRGAFWGNGGEEWYESAGWIKVIYEIYLNKCDILILGECFIKGEILKRKRIFTVFFFAVVAVIALGISVANAASNEVTWNYYESGAHLVINGENTEYGRPSQSGTIDINNDSYSMSQTEIPWYANRLYSQIKTVEFAATTKPTNMDMWFDGCRELVEIDSKNLDTSAVISMRYMFQDCTALSDLTPLSDWDTRSVGDMTAMFQGCTTLSDITSLSDWDLNSGPSMRAMFQYCTTLSDLTPLSDWDTGSVGDMTEMFHGCVSLTDLSPLSGWDTSHVGSMEGMFAGCMIKDTSPIANWDVGLVGSFGHIYPYSYGMFQGCTSLVVAHLDGWNPDNSVGTDKMFSGCIGLKTIYCRNSWSPSSNSDMFDGCIQLISNTTGKTYADGHGSAMANPKTGLFTIPPGEKTSLSIQKVVLDESGKPVEDWSFELGQFKFEISSDSGAPLPKNLVAETDETGKATWPEIEFSDYGEYTYQVKEVEGNVPNVAYDTEPHEMKVTVNSRPSWPNEPNEIPRTQMEFNDTSWEDMAKLAARCASEGTADYEHLLGFTKDVDVEGVGIVKAKLIGLNHDTYTDGGTAGFTFQLTDGLSYSSPVLFDMNSFDTSSGGWAASEMRNTNLPKLLTALPSDLQGLIKKVDKQTSTVSTGTEVSTTSDDLFLLSLVESVGKTTTAYSDNPVAMGSPSFLENEGTQYEYYVKHPTLNDHIIKSNTGSAHYWCLRSMNLDNAYLFHGMNGTGRWSGNFAREGGLPAAGFCL